MQQQDSATLHPVHQSVREGIAQSSTAVGWRHHLWFALLVGASIAFSLGFACAAPLAAFSAAAALTLSRRDALALTLAVWLANQLVGFTVLGYPSTASTLAWGVALAVAAVLATLAAQSITRRLAEAGRAVSFAATFLVAFAAYEAVLFAVAVALLGGTEDFTAAIIGRIFAINAAAFVGLLVLSRFGMAAGLITNPEIPGSMSVTRA